MALDGRLVNGRNLDMSQVLTRLNLGVSVGRCDMPNCDGALMVADIECVDSLTWVNFRCSLCAHESSRANRPVALAG